MRDLRLTPVDLAWVRQTLEFDWLIAETPEAEAAAIAAIEAHDRAVAALERTP